MEDRIKTLEQFKANIETFDDCSEDLLKAYRGEVEQTFSTGLDGLDELLRLQTKRLAVITGMSGRGKTFITHNILFNTYKQYGWKHLICSLEGETTDMFNELAQMEMKKSTYDSDYKMSEEEYIQAKDKLSNNFLRFKTSKYWKIDEIIDYATFAVKNYGIKTITLDPYNKLDTKDSGREDQDIALMLNKLLAFAKEYDVLVIFVAHPTTGSAREKDYIPDLYDISGGGNWMNMCDYGISVHRYLDENQKKRNQTKVIVHKVKSKAIGDPSGGTIYLDYNFKEHRLTKPFGETHNKDWEEENLFSSKKGKR